MVHRAHQRHSWDKTQPSLPAAMLAFPGEHRWVQLSCTGTYLLRRVCCRRDCASVTSVLLAAWAALASGCLLCPSGTSSREPHYLGVRQNPSNLSFIGSQLVRLRHSSHLGALPATLSSRKPFLPCPHAQSSMLNYLPLLPLGITKALTQWDCLCA